MLQHSTTLHCIDDESNPNHCHNLCDFINLIRNIAHVNHMSLCLSAFCNLLINSVDYVSFPKPVCKKSRIFGSGFKKPAGFGLGRVFTYFSPSSKNHKKMKQLPGLCDA
ncbi:CLUMA_CG016849, isoform A [Clunio marinus]|uniref:CLUMA_CG016849, isoform A n=1 Tax=Clunio marinus TaxID=568069 RepID=A0A1J1ISW4_9DIPT|nr:CLUMA_CG016849, isoform A [Clunio marinus]